MDETPDRRRLHRTVPWKKGEGVYASSDSMHAVQKIGSHQWVRGARQPYHIEGQWDFKGPKYKRLRDAQTEVETEETERPRISTMQTQFHDRRGY